MTCYYLMVFLSFHASRPDYPYYVAQMLIVFLFLVKTREYYLQIDLLGLRLIEIFALAWLFPSVMSAEEILIVEWTLFYLLRYALSVSFFSASNSKLLNYIV